MTRSSKLDSGLLIPFIVWYVCSAACNTTSRKILVSYVSSPLVITCVQFLVASMSLWALINVVKVVENKPIQDAAHVDDAKRILIRLSACYAIGFLFVNFGYSILTVSLAETLRSAEPLLRCSHRCVREKRVCHPQDASLPCSHCHRGVIRKLQRRIVFNYCSYFRHSLEYLLCGAFGADEKSRGGVHRMPIQYILSRICFGCAHAHWIVSCCRIPCPCGSSSCVALTMLFVRARKR